MFPLYKYLSEIFDIKAIPSKIPGIDFQSNDALKKPNPKEFAQDVISRYATNWCCISASGPGYINIVLNDNFLIDCFNKISIDPNLGYLPDDHNKETKVVIDYGGFNICKALHVGHLRSSIIGNSLYRLYQFAGYNISSDCHLGDWGTQMGMLIVGLSGTDNFTLQILEDTYRKINSEMKCNPELQDKCRLAIKELQDGKPDYLDLWNKFSQISLKAITQSMDRLGIDFDYWYGESRYQPVLDKLIQKLISDGIAEESQGAIIIKNGLEVPMVIRKQDKGFLYATTDLATMRERVEEMKADKIIYVVDKRQELHFTNLFKASEMMGFTVEKTFIGFGTINGPDGKPIKTRDGSSIKLDDLLDTIEEKAKDKDIALATLKFADLSHHPKLNYNFNIDKFVSFEGKTGPYLQYVGTRIKSILRKVDVNPKRKLFETEKLELQERNLIMEICNFSSWIEKALKGNDPSKICDGAYTLAQAFTKFYENKNCRVVGIDDRLCQEKRILLCKTTYKVLETYLNLLGITIPDKM